VGSLRRVTKTSKTGAGSRVSRRTTDTTRVVVRTPHGHEFVVNLGQLSSSKRRAWQTDVALANSFSGAKSQAHIERGGRQFTTLRDVMTEKQHARVFKGRQTTAKSVTKKSGKTTYKY
jgi:hypothetical protein